MGLMALPVTHAAEGSILRQDALELDMELVTRFLVSFLQDECIRQRGIRHAVLGLSGGVDSAVTAALCARAFGPENVTCFRMPYKLSSPESLAHAQLIVDQFGVKERTIDITAMVDGYLCGAEPEADGARIGNVCARCRMIVLFDQSAKLRALPIGTGNKTERLFGYFTWHADDTPPLNPLGDLYKTQVWALARHLGIPEVIVEKPATADLVKGQTDEGDFGISYGQADRILNALIRGYPVERLAAQGIPQSDIDIVVKRVDGTHWKRKPATVAMLSDSAIGEYYLRPVDYR